MLEFEFYNYLPIDAKRIREEVFVIEQGFNEEFDSIDNSAIHVLVKYNGKYVATSRAYKESEKRYHIGRVAVLKEYRFLKIGSQMISKLEEKLKELNVKEVVLGSQIKAKEFYKKNGYSEYGDIYLDEGCPHILMKKNLN